MTKKGQTDQPTSKRRKARKSRKRDFTREDLVSVLNHDTRIRLLRIFFEDQRPISPREFADRLGMKLPNVGYHVRVLAEKNIIELREEEAVRGSVAHFYELTDGLRRNAWVRAALAADDVRTS